MNNNRMLVLGATGFIGRHIVSRALDAGWNVSAFVRKTKLSSELASATSKFPDRLRIHPGLDLEDGSTLSRVIDQLRPQAVIHAAAVGAKPGEYDTAKTVAINLAATSTLLTACRLGNIGQVVLFGSAVCYGPSTEPHSEQEQLLPENEYGLVKALCSEVAAYHNRTGFDRVVELRLFNIYGPNDTSNRMVPYVLRQALLDKPVELTVGNQERDFVYIQDVVDVVLSAAGGEVPAGSYNVSTQTPTSIADVARSLISMTGSKSVLRIGSIGERSDRHMRLTGRADRLRQLGISPKTSLSDGLQATIEAACQNLSSKQRL